MVEAPPAAGTPTPPLLCSLAQYHNCILLILMLIVTAFPYFCNSLGTDNDDMVYDAAGDVIFKSLNIQERMNETCILQVKRVLTRYGTMTNR